MATAATQPIPATEAAGHWPEYLMEAALLACFMISACSVAVLLDHPSSPVYRSLPDPFIRRFLGGLAMGGTAILLIYSPWGRRSGAHFNPASTLTFLRLGMIARRDAIWYGAAQFAGGLAGVLTVAALFGPSLAHEGVQYAVTRPGVHGVGAAWLAELVMTFMLFTVVLRLSSHPRYARQTGLAVGALVFIYITLEAPLSGMSMNPARSFGSAAGAGSFSSLWIYFTAPPLGMLLATEVFVRARGLRAVHCAKLHHQNAQPCIFRCGYAAAEEVSWTTTT